MHSRRNNSSFAGSKTGAPFSSQTNGMNIFDDCTWNGRRSFIAPRDSRSLKRPPPRSPLTRRRDAPAIALAYPHVPARASYVRTGLHELQLFLSFFSSLFMFFSLLFFCSFFVFFVLLFFIPPPPPSPLFFVIFPAPVLHRWGEEPGREAGASRHPSLHAEMDFQGGSRAAGGVGSPLALPFEGRH
jgi:hypothetical protein